MEIRLGCHFRGWCRTFEVSRTQDLEMSLSILAVKDFFGWWRVALVTSRHPTCVDMVTAHNKDREHMQLFGSRQVEETTYDDFDWVVLLEYPILSSGVKTLA